MKTAPSGRIAESARLPLGGIDQWVMIRGRDVANPVLITLHGGPGMPETALLRHFNGALEEVFTVVYWEQRGAGKSFSKAIAPQSMTVDRFMADLDELVDHVRARLAKDKVVLLGHSWGSALGTLYAARHPQKVAAYVGTGQIGDLPASENASYVFVLAEAKRRGNKKAIAELTKLGPPPYSEKQMMVQRGWLARFAGTLGRLPMLKALRIMVTGPGASPLDLPGIVRGMRFSLKALWREVSALNLERDAPELKMPVYFLSGRNDHQVDAGVAAAYFDKLVAPAKTLIWFETAGHFVPFEAPEAFNAAMAEIAAGLKM
ncbi:MAG TPA: alpha/beta hydrolase [Rhizomicrobium sp.]|jgi:pimeloyl-ACP methyl ester carboxylesterase|nr:alpha/beta hydrolase [Rhizomicrobium sp.]